MFEKTIDFIAQYLSGFVIVLVMLVTFLGCLYLASLDSESSGPKTSDRAKLCLYLHSDNCF